MSQKVGKDVKVDFYVLQAVASSDLCMRRVNSYEISWLDTPTEPPIVVFE